LTDLQRLLALPVPQREAVAGAIAEAGVIGESPGAVAGEAALLHQSRCTGAVPTQVVLADSGDRLMAACSTAGTRQGRPLSSQNAGVAEAVVAAVHPDD